MTKKIVMNVMFEKRRVMMFLLVMCMLLVVYASVQTMLVSNEIATVDSMPDFVFNGTVYNSQDGSYPFVGYNDIGSFAEKAQEIAGDQADCYGVVYRSLYNYYDELTGVGFFGAVYGIPDECIRKIFSQYLSEGSLPETGKKEALVGYYFAQRFGISIGDTIPQAITLCAEWEEEDIDNYIVCGILDESISSYFNGSAVISRETYEGIYGEAGDNMVFGYYNSDENYDTIFLDICAEGKNYRVPEGKLNYKQKEYGKLKIIVNIGVVIFMSISLTTAIISYLMKGVTPKVGLLKAIGISSSYILKAFLSGITAVVAIAMLSGIVISNILIAEMNNYVSEFYKFEVHLYQFTLSSLLVGFCQSIFIILYVFIIIFIKSKMISPKIAMTKTI